MDKFEMLEKAMCKELDAIERKLEGGQEMSIQDLEKADKLAHAMKSLITYKAMKEAEEYESEGMSGRRGRGMDGRYISRTSAAGNSQSYADGYSRGYSEAMNQMSGNSYARGYSEAMNQMNSNGYANNNQRW